MYKRRAFSARGPLGSAALQRAMKAHGFSILRKLYHRLLKALPEQMVLSQVELSRLLGVKKGENFASAATHRDGGSTILFHFDH